MKTDDLDQLDQLGWARIRLDAAIIELKQAYELLAAAGRRFEAEQAAHLGILLARLRDRIRVMR